MSHFFVMYPTGMISNMTPTLPMGRRVVVDRLTYRQRDPAVGEIVMLVPPRTGRFHSTSNLAGRIVAIGGETVQMLSDRVYVNGKERDLLPRVSHGPDEDGFHPPYGVQEPYQVPAGYYFVVGDDRSNIFDSRSYGAVPRESIVGRIVKTL